MKRIFLLNSCNYGSTGNICLDIMELAKQNGFMGRFAYPSSRSNFQRITDNSVFIGNRLERNLHLLLSKYTGFNGCFSQCGTASFLRQVEDFEPMLMHIHNLHNCYINLPMLFQWVKKNKVKVVWTLHDCWPFTGHCPHFEMVGCEKWKTECFDCPQYKEYPASKFDNSKKMYRLKKKWFTGVQNLTIVTPSRWLAGLVKQSFLKEYPVKVINNGIDLSVFHPTDSDFRERYGLKDKKILLGVASPWSVRKGLDVFIGTDKNIATRHYRD